MNWTEERAARNLARIKERERLLFGGLVGSVIGLVVFVLTYVLVRL